MPNLAGIRAAIKTALASVDGLNLYDYRAVRPELNAAVIKGMTFNPRIVFGPVHWEYQLDVQLLVGGADDAAANTILAGLIAEDGTINSSVMVALRADPTLGGACQTSDVVQGSEDGWLEFYDGSVVALACTLSIQVTT